jgi:hypothetical protein
MDEFSNIAIEDDVNEERNNLSAFKGVHKIEASPS